MAQLQGAALIVVIPARMASARFPGKPLYEIDGVPMVRRVYEQALKANVGKVYVATPDREIFDIVPSIMTGIHPTGSDRVNAAANIVDPEKRHNVINLQGDLPWIQPETIRAVAAAEGNIVTAAWKDHNHVHVSFPEIRFERVNRHIGIYNFRRPALEAFARSPQTPEEKQHSLEQLRFPDIRVVFVEPTESVDEPV